MGDADYKACHYSVTVRADDLAVLHMLRGLAQHCESGTYKQIAWGGTSAQEWAAAGNRVTFRFSAPADRAQFLAEAERLLVPACWGLIGKDDSDPATRRRS
jgi:hypothetical protein